MPPQAKVYRILFHHQGANVEDGHKLLRYFKREGVTSIVGTARCKVLARGRRYKITTPDGQATELHNGQWSPPEMAESPRGDTYIWYRAILSDGSIALGWIRE